MTNLQKALCDPASVYRNPQQILDDASLTRVEKSKILHQWEHDAREMSVATEENMPGDDDLLDEVLAALHQLGEFRGEAESGSTKHGD